MKKNWLFIFILFVPAILMGQKIYKIDASNIKQELKTDFLRMGNPGPDGREIRINNRYMAIGGRPVVPVMGEVHFSRVPRSQWEESILKMKACGVNVIASYIFWNHHEEVEGQFDWSGNKDLRAFVELCQKHDLYVYPRVGPWCHGEVRNGGTPDWILRKKQIKDRSGHPVYQAYVRRYFGEIARQLHDLYLKDNGPVIGIQLENEYWYAKAGEAHIRWLKETALQCGMDVPMYTVTGWNNGSVPPGEVIPLWGGYADAPWADHIHKEIDESYFSFSAFHNDERIGNERAQHEGQYMDYDNYPYFTCEMGIGIQNTYHRRLVISPIDGLTMVTAKLGSGSNLIGYYIFTGGSNPHGLLHPTEEDQGETGYWTQVPAKSYDFQAAIRESGERSPAYDQLKKLHYFLNEFGEQLAPMVPVIGQAGNNELQYAIRAGKESAFLFGINYCRYVPKPLRCDIQFEVRLASETVRLPSCGVEIPDSSVFIWPVNMKLGNILLKYATAQPLCQVDDVSVFFQNAGIDAEFLFDAASVEKISSANGTVTRHNKEYLVSNLTPGTGCIISLTGKDGQEQKIIVLSPEDALQAWLFLHKGKKDFYLSEAGMYMNGDRLNIYGENPVMQFKKLGSGTTVRINGTTVNGRSSGMFTEFEVSSPARSVAVKAEPNHIFDDAVWLKTAEDDLPENKQLFHRFFLKEFSLDNPSEIQDGTLFLFPPSSCRINVNNRWVNQEIIPGKMNMPDLTAYLQKGENVLYLDFPFTKGEKVFAARMSVTFSNTDRIEFSTDSSWLTKDMYNYPSLLKDYGTLVAPETVPAPANAKEITCDGFKEWKIYIPYHYSNNLNAVYLHLDYTGDRAELYAGHLLVADDYNSQTTWRIGLNRLDVNPEGQNLKLRIYPLSPGNRIFFDRPPEKGEAGEALLQDIKVIPEYRLTGE